MLKCASCFKCDLSHLLPLTWECVSLSLLEEAERKEGKEEKKAAAPAPEEELDECEQALAAEPKAKDPFAHLPKRYGCWRAWDFRLSIQN